MLRSLFKLITNTYRMAEPHESRTVLANAAFLSGLQVITYLLPVIVLPYLFRVLGPEKFGLIFFALAFVQYFMILTDYGFNISATKEISLHREQPAKINEIFSSIMTLKLFFAFAGLIALITVISLVPKFEQDWLLYALSFGVVIGNSLFPLWFFQGMERMKYIAGLSIIGELLYVVGVFALIKGPQDYLKVPLINSMVFLTTGALGQFLAFRDFKIKFKPPKYHDLQRQLDLGWNIFISNVAINTYTNTRIFAVGLLTNNTLTGLYSIAEKIATIAQTFPLASFTQAVFPRLSKIYAKNKIKAFMLMNQIQLITTNIALILLPVIFLVAPWIVKLACGQIYPETVTSLRLLIVSVFFISANAFRVQFLLVSGKTDLYSKIHITMAIVGFPLILLLISSFSYVGAAGATVLIELGILTLTYLAIKKLKLS